MISDQSVQYLLREIGCVEDELNNVATAYLEWQERVLAPFGAYCVKRTVKGTFPEVLSELLPLVEPVRTKAVFWPLHSGRTAFTDNRKSGADAASTASVLAKILGTSALRAAHKPESPRTFEGTAFELYDHMGTATRTLFAINEDGRWEFGETGTPLSFEKGNAFTGDRIRDRFTGDMLTRYLDELGCNPRSVRLNSSGQLVAVLVERRGSAPKGFTEYAHPCIDQNSM